MRLKREEEGANLWEHDHSALAVRFVHIRKFALKANDSKKGKWCSEWSQTVTSKTMRSADSAAMRSV